MSNQTRITVDRVKTAKFASEETLCFRARVLLDGEPFAYASNDGHGGCTNVQPIENRERHMRALEAAEAYAASLPETVTEFKKGEPFSYRETLGDICEALAGQWEFDQSLLKRFKRDMKNKVMYSDGGALYEYRITDALARGVRMSAIRRERPDALILNQMPPAEGFEVYRAHVVVKDI